jgi:hypothetical protein
MASFKEQVKAVVPTPLWQAVSQARYAAERAAEWPQATFDPLRRESIHRLSQLKDSAKGQRCVIIANGPSLKKMDLSVLKNVPTFGMNRIYLMFPELGFQTTYHVTVNNLVIEQCAEDIRALSMPRFVSWRARRLIQPAHDLNYLWTTYTGPKFATDARRRIWEGATVTNVTLQLAYHMGYQQVILIGCDHSYTEKGKPNTTVVSQGDDPNHFNAAYFGKGFRWQLPDLDTSEVGYQMAKEAFAADGREVLDATVDGKLTVFRKVDFKTMFA